MKCSDNTEHIGFFFLKSICVRGMVQEDTVHPQNKTLHRPVVRGRMCRNGFWNSEQNIRLQNYKQIYKHVFRGLRSGIKRKYT